MLKKIINKLKSPVVIGCLIVNAAAIAAMFDPSISNDIKEIGGIAVAIINAFAAGNNPDNPTGY